MVTGIEGIPSTELPVWPSSSETPRYRFAGIFYGEQNIQAVDGETTKTALTKVLKWIVGLFDYEQPKQLQSPQSGVVDENGVIYVTDVATGSVFVFDGRDIERASPKLPEWQQATHFETFIAPIAIALGPDQQLLVTDAELGEVFRLNRQGDPLGRFGAGILNRPTGISRDASRGEIYVADTQDHDIKVFDDAGQLIRTVSHRGTREGELNFPIHISFVRDKLYVVDSMNARIQVFDPLGNHLLSFGHRGKYQGQFSRPKGIAVDSEDNIYVVDSYFDYLLVFNSEGKFLIPIGGTGDEVGSFYLPSGVWIDDRDRVYVADMSNGRVFTMQFLGGD
jgi:DNA-binding beta-propeller fold protein YncE